MNLNAKETFIKALLVEIELRKTEFENENIETVYLGGGTPTLLSEYELKEIFRSLHRNFKIEPAAEVTIEANPDDLTEKKIRELKQTPVNRFSIGIQSFYDDDLKFMNRSHDAAQAETCIKLAQDAGFRNITIDLIYGIPVTGRGTRDEGRETNTSSMDKFKRNLEKINNFNVPHFSAYCLTVEQKTVLEKLIREKKCADINDDDAARQFEMLMDFAEQNGYEHYEISNFARPGFYSRHNTSYWTGKKYLGLGPSAHSYDGISRQWNIANNTLYIQSLAQAKLPFEKEELTENDRFNEYIMTSLRTKHGIDKIFLKEKFGDNKVTLIEKNSAKFIIDKLLIEENDTIRLTRAGKLFADRIISDLFETD